MSKFDNSSSQVPNYYGTQEGTQFTPGDNFDQHGDGFHNKSQFSQHQGQSHSQNSDLDRSRDCGDRGQDFNNDNSRKFDKDHGVNAFNSDRPLNTKPVPEGGVARDGCQGLPEGKAGFADKVVGKTEKVTGSVTKNRELHEKGELRETGGKAAQFGQARAAHD